LIFAVISDVHANLEAVETCFMEIDKIRPDRIICLGDLVDYCAEPNEVMDIIRARCSVVLMGNHDEAQIDYSLSDGFSHGARISSVYTRSVLKPEHRDYIKTLKYTHSENGLLFVHGSPYRPMDYNYITAADEAAFNFRKFEEDVCFIGHSHQPVVFRKTRFGAKPVAAKDVKKGNRYIINSGSVGQPRDGDSRLAFGLFDLNSFVYTQVRLSYDIKNAAHKIINKGLPVSLAERLFAGK
jgi:predicted phosphodiesterase